jgi:hypothetical protein
VTVDVWIIRAEQSDAAITGRDAFRLESVTVRARRQLSAMQPSGARRSIKRFALARAESPAIRMENDFMVIEKRQWCS